MDAIKDAAARCVEWGVYFHSSCLWDLCEDLQPCALIHEEVLFPIVGDAVDAGNVPGDDHDLVGRTVLLNQLHDLPAYQE